MPELAWGKQLKQIWGHSPFSGSKLLIWFLVKLLLNSHKTKRGLRCRVQVSDWSLQFQHNVGVSVAERLYQPEDLRFLLVWVVFCGSFLGGKVLRVPSAEALPLTGMLCALSPCVTAPAWLCRFLLLTQIQTEAAFCAPVRLSSFMDVLNSRVRLIEQ